MLTSGWGGAGVERGPAAARDDGGDAALGEHGEDVSGAGEHERERVGAVGDEVAEGLVGVAEEVHHGGAEEDPSRELRAQRQERLVPPHEVGGHAAGQGAYEHHGQAPQLRRHQPRRPQVRRLPAAVRVGVPVVAAMGPGRAGGRAEEQYGEVEAGAGGPGHACMRAAEFSTPCAGTVGWGRRNQRRGEGIYTAAGSLEGADVWALVVRVDDFSPWLVAVVCLYYLYFVLGTW